MQYPAGAEIVAAASGALLAEWLKPAGTFKGSAANFGLGIAGGFYGPQMIEAYLEALRRAHEAVTFCCSFAGSAVLRWFSDKLSERKFAEWAAPITAAVEAFRKTKPPEGGHG